MLILLNIISQFRKGLLAGDCPAPESRIVRGCEQTISGSTICSIRKSQGKITLRKLYPDFLGSQIVPVSTILALFVGIRENWHRFLAVLKKADGVNGKFNPTSEGSEGAFLVGDYNWKKT
jgi:hypothetical protein